MAAPRGGSLVVRPKSSAGKPKSSDPDIMYLIEVGTVCE